jgi:hypothetical protein
MPFGSHLSFSACRPLFTPIPIRCRFGYDASDDGHKRLPDSVHCSNLSCHCEIPGRQAGLLHSHRVSHVCLHATAVLLARTASIRWFCISHHGQRVGHASPAHVIRSDMDYGNGDNFSLQVLLQTWSPANVSETAVVSLSN